jgi:formylglycine-generating enzyme required for sulfatase activity
VPHTLEQAKLKYDNWRNHALDMAKRSMQAKQFDEAMKCILDYETARKQAFSADVEFIHLKQKCQVYQARSAFQQMKKLMSGGLYQEALDRVEKIENLESLLRDSSLVAEFRQLKTQCEFFAIKQQKKATQINYIVTASLLGFAIIFTIALVSFLGFRFKRAEFIGERLGQGDYEAVLSLEPRNADAIRLKEIAEALRAGDYTTALSIDPENKQALQMKTAAFLRMAPISNSIGMELKLIPAGSVNLSLHYLSAGKLIQLSTAFYIGTSEVTQEQFQTVMGQNPSHFQHLQKPVERVSWKDATEFCRRLSDMPEEKKAGRVYRLPTEAEWDYASQGGNSTKMSFGNELTNLNEYCWFANNSGNSPLDTDKLTHSTIWEELKANGCQTHIVRLKKPNPWGIYDMYGNVEEWCSDEELGLHVIRGGSWKDGPSTFEYFRSDIGDLGRELDDYKTNWLGFRVAFDMPKKL